MTAKETLAECRIEPGVTNNKNGNIMVLPGRIWKRDDLMLIATGSPACVRGVYNTAVKLNKLHQYRYCLMEAIDLENYEKWLTKLDDVLHNALGEPWLGGVVIYASCLDFLHKAILNRFVEDAEKKATVPIKILYRGAVVPQKKPLEEFLAELLDEIPEGKGKLSTEEKSLPAMQTDFAGLADMLQEWDTYNLMVDAGGCTECFSLPKSWRQNYHLKKSRFSSFGALKSCQLTFPDIIKEDWNTSGNEKPCCLFQSPIPKISKFDMDLLRKNLHRSGIDEVYCFKTDGFHSHIEGISNAMLQLYNGSHSEKVPVKQPLIGILGSSRMQSASLDKIGHGIEHIEWDGYGAMFPKDNLLNSWGNLNSVKMNWVVSAQGVFLAQKIQETQGIPYIAAIPVGARSMKLWLNKINGYMNSNKALAEVPEKTSLRREEKVLLLGDPVLTLGIYRFLREMLGFHQIELALYAPFHSLREWYTQAVPLIMANGLGDCQRPEIHLFSDREQWLELASGCDIIIGDNTFNISGALSDKIWINITDPSLYAGEEEMNDKYLFFGKKGAAWLENKIHRQKPI